VISLVAGLGILALTAQAPRGDACAPFHPFDGMTSLLATASLETDVLGSCALVATIPPSSQPTIPGAFVWYRRPVPTAPLRVSFHLSQNDPEQGPFDTYALLVGNPMQHTFFDYGVDYPLLVEIGGDNVADHATLIFGGVCANVAGGSCFERIPIPVPIDATVRFEVDTNPSGGSIRAWLNADFTDPPIAELAGIDNAATGGVASVSLGAFAPTGRYTADGVNVRISAVESSDDTIFFSSLDGGSRP
jgi:hypothetical protein